MAVSHAYTFSRNKGIITFIDHDADKSYDFNINTGIMTNASTGRQINSCPAGFGKFLENYHGEDCVVRFMDNARRSPMNMVFLLIIVIAFSAILVIWLMRLNF